MWPRNYIQGSVEVLSKAQHILTEDEALPCAGITVDEIMV